jgi:hypothetical protein
MNDTPTPRTNEAFLDGYTFCKEDMMPAVAFASQLERELTAVTEQRDRLAEALKNLVKANEIWNQGMMDVIGRPPNWNDSYLNEAKQALQSLTTNEL